LAESFWYKYSYLARNPGVVFDRAFGTVQEPTPRELPF